MSYRVVEHSQQEIQEALMDAKDKLNPKTAEVLQDVVQAYSNLVNILQDDRITIDRLKRMLFGAKTEKTRSVFKQNNKHKNHRSNGNGRRPGHGRNSAADYLGAQKVFVHHESLKHGERCPNCRRGKIYRQKEDGILVRLKGRTPLQATVYHLQKLRCNLCLDIFEAAAPAGVGSQKYDETSASMIALLKYGSGLPFNRLQKLQENAGIPLPAATQWEIVKDASRKIDCVYEELIIYAAQGKVLHNDDTSMKILAYSAGNGKLSTEAESGTQQNRKGVFTSGIASCVKIGQTQRQIALFFTGRKHAGENLIDVLKNRENGLPKPIQMCDALSRNAPQEIKTILANCMAHARRQFVEAAENFPQECKYVLKAFMAVYRNEELIRQRKLTDTQRLRFHREHSLPVMDKLHVWMKGKIQRKDIEPNSGLGQAITYMLKHYDRLTLFTKRRGAPLDNNLCERVLKKAILHRKNALFYKTINGARVGDIFMSLIHTCELNHVNAFDYLTELLRHVIEVRANPKQWMPWNYHNAPVYSRGP